MEAVLVGILAASGIAAFVVGRWWTVFVPIVALGLFYAGLNARWWGDGVGDGWQFVMALVMGIGVLAAVVGVAARGLVSLRSQR